MGTGRRIGSRFPRGTGITRTAGCAARAKSRIAGAKGRIADAKGRIADAKSRIARAKGGTAFAAGCAALAAVATGCAGLVDSPRAPYAVPAAAAGDGEPNPFEIIPDWAWARSVPGEVERGHAEGALASAFLGLFDARRFTLAAGRCDDCGPESEAALNWFRDELVAVPRTAEGPTNGLPPVVWIGAPQRVAGARLSENAATLRVGGTEIGFALGPRLATNAAYLDASTARYFSGRPLRVRGAVSIADGEPKLVARTIFPDDARFDFQGLGPEPLQRNETLATLIEAQAGAAQPFRPRVLHARGDPRRWGGRPVVALILSGAQGDDDGSRAGHLAVATGVLGPRGEWHDWLVTNFYPLADANAKGIIPAPLPIDNYLYDLNSGQLLYRPGYMLVAVLRAPRVPMTVQAALQRTMLQLYCGTIEFDRARLNSTAMTIDPLRELGWRIPGTGATSRVAGLAAAPFAMLFRGFRVGTRLYASLAEERTRLLPRVAFEVAGHDLLALTAERADVADGALTDFERAIAEDVDGVFFVRLPQVPSARRFGTYPVPSLLAYAAAIIADPADYENAPEAGMRERPERLEGCPPP